ncbi:MULTISPECIES: hypothetical protein [Brucella]|uniref:hypothetical protein n=1 Tax=Brucella TaxID=234 RepID=UPI001FFCD9CF|nr:hypothetical protein [Brucella intermedia]
MNERNFEYVRKTEQGFAFKYEGGEAESFVNDNAEGNNDFHNIEAWIAAGNTIEQVEAPAAPLVTVIPSVTLWERMTEAEAAQVEAAMSRQPFRTRQIFMTANTFRSDHELWPLLVSMATDLFGETRTAELLAKP